MKRLAGLAPIIALIACDDDPTVVIVDDREAPSGLFYELEASGEPGSPSGAILRWDAVSSSDLEVYRVYSRASSGGRFDLRASTTSTSFHEDGPPDLEYRVSAFYFDGVESGPSNTVTIDERLALDSPESLVTTSLDGAIHMNWSDNAFLAEPDGFRRYRVYSASYSLDFDECGDNWSLEGTTVAPEFISSALTNGQSRCFAVSAESIEGFESLWSNIRADTPRPDARNVLMFALSEDPDRAGFRYFQDFNGDGAVSPIELGIVTSGNSGSIDFRFFRDVSGDVFIEPVRSGVSVALYSDDPVADLTSIDWVPDAGFDVTPIEAVAGFGYVVEMPGGDGFARYGALRMTHVGEDYVIFDWSYQTDPGNPELSVSGGQRFSNPWSIPVGG